MLTQKILLCSKSGGISTSDVAGWMILGFTLFLTFLLSCGNETESKKEQCNSYADCPAKQVGNVLCLGCSGQPGEVICIDHHCSYVDTTEVNSGSYDLTLEVKIDSPYIIDSLIMKIYHRQMPDGNLLSCDKIKQDIVDDGKNYYNLLRDWNDGDLDYSIRAKRPITMSISHVPSGMSLLVIRGYDEKNYKGGVKVLGCQEITVIKETKENLVLTLEDI